MVAGTWKSVGHSPPVHRLRQIQGLVEDRVLLGSVRTSQDSVVAEWENNTHTVAAVHTTMCLPEQHREPTTRAIKRVE